MKLLFFVILSFSFCCTFSHCQTESVIYSFGQTSNDILFPQYGLALDASGSLYSTAHYGGLDSAGGVFQLSPESGGTWKEEVLHLFLANGSKDGDQPYAAPVVDDRGNVFVTTYYGGTGTCLFGCGAVVQIKKHSGKWTERVIYDFGSHRMDGQNPLQLTLDPSGKLFGTTIFGGLNGDGTFYGLTPASGKWKENILYDFGSGESELPTGGLLRDAAGNLYGTTLGGGVNHYGSVFELSPLGGGAWNYKTLYSFGREGEETGPNPNPNLAMDAAGNIYGTTVSGGLRGTCYPYTCGTVFKLTQDSNGTWEKKAIHSFAGGIEDGGNPYDGVVLDSAGNLYGTTDRGGGGGPSACAAGLTPIYCGIVFKLTARPDGTFKEEILHRFTGSPDGGHPDGRPVMDPLGNLYGTSSIGGASAFCGGGCGTVWRLAPQ